MMGSATALAGMKILRSVTLCASRQSMDPKSVIFYHDTAIFGIFHEGPIHKLF